MTQMDRTVYFNTETCSTLSEDSYQRSPEVSSRPSKEHVNVGSFKNYRDGGSKTVLMGTGSGSNQFRNPPTQNYSIFGSPAPQQTSNKKNANAGGLTRKTLHSGISRIAIPVTKDRDDLEYHYGNILVLHLQCKNLSTMTPGALDPFSSLKNLYLYKNNIRRIQGLERLFNLELLDLSRNNVDRIDNLENCKKLKKLYFGFNEIQVMEGLEGLTALEELHVDDQDIPPEQPLIFAPGIMAFVAHSLLALDLSSNQLSTLQPIASLPLLSTLIAADNLLEDIDDVLDTLQSLRQLRILNLKGNPIAKSPYYKSKVIGSVYRLEGLDGKDINDTTRSCMQKLRIMREYRKLQKEEAAKANPPQSRNLQDPSQTLVLPYKTDEFTFSTPTRLSPQPLSHLQLPPFIPSSKPFTKTHQFLKTKYSTLNSTKSTPTPISSDNEDSRPDTSVEEPYVPILKMNSSTVYANQTPPFTQTVDSSFYVPRVRNGGSIGDEDGIIDIGGGGDQMSDMAKIIFRLSNLDEDSIGDATASNIKYANYWELPGSSVNRECRPLSPLDVQEKAPIYSSSAPELDFQKPLENLNKKRPNANTRRPKPATIGGRRCSGTNSGRAPNGGIPVLKCPSDSTGLAEKYHTPYYYGRTLSPLIELPTPDSGTAREGNIHASNN